MPYLLIFNQTIQDFSDVLSKNKQEQRAFLSGPLPT